MNELKRLINLTDDIELFRSPDGRLWATVAEGSHCETWELASGNFANLLRRRFYRVSGGAAAGHRLREAVRHLEARAQFDSPERPVVLRVGVDSGRTYLDLANQDWQVIEIDAEGWRMLNTSPVIFRRVGGMQPLPLPVRGGSIDELRRFINIGNDSEWMLLVGWIVAALAGHGPFPILALRGEHGTAKSTVARIVRALVDPNTVELRSEPTDVRDLFIAATNNWILSLDNLSHIGGWFSDALCRLATGGGFATRELYSDTREVLLQVQRPVILTGIGELAVRGDLLDRCLTLELPPISPTQRIAEEDFWREFHALRPSILAALLDCLSGALRDLPSTHLARLPRMADFVVLVSAAEATLGWPQGSFVQAYLENQSDANQAALETSVVVQPLFALLAEGPFEGTAASLLNALVEKADQRTLRQHTWPKSALTLSNVLRRLAPNLRVAGVEATFSRSTNRMRTRLIKLSFSASAASAASTILSGSATAESKEMANAIDSEHQEIKRVLREVALQSLEAGNSKAAVAALSAWSKIVQFQESRRTGKTVIQDDRLYSEVRQILEMTDEQLLGYIQNQQQSIQTYGGGAGSSSARETAPASEKQPN